MSAKKNKSIFNFISVIFRGIYYIFDFIVSVILTIFSSIYYALEFVFKYVFKFIKYVFEFIWKNLALEIYEIIKDFFVGIYTIIKLPLYDIPKIFVGFVVKILEKLKKKIVGSAKDTSKTSFKDILEKIKNYFINKYNNLSIVKYYKNKKERELEILYIDKDSEDAKRSEAKHAYQYLARNKEGKLIKGYFMALSKLDTHSYLLDEGYEVYEIITSKWIDFIHGDSFFGNKKMSMKDLIFWLAQLSTYVKSGITLTESVKILAKQNKNKKYKKAFDSMIYELTMGESFSESLRKQGNMFPALLVNMVKAAEKMGDIEATLDDMSEYYDQMDKNKKSIISALTYPIIIFIFSIVVIIFIMAYIIPQFVDVYSDMGAQLNPYTQFIINVSDFIVANWRFLILGIIGTVLICIVVFRKVKAFKTAIQYIFMHIPIIGKVIIYNEMTRFSKTFAALNKSNVLLTESIDILGKITNNEFYKMIMYDTISNLLRGDKMSIAFKDNWAVPELAYYMISTGESTGQLSEMLERVADYFQNEQQTVSNMLKAFIEPIMIAFLAVIVGGVVLAIIIPMFGMYSAGLGGM